MENIFRQLKCFNWRLFVALCVLAFIPAIYQTIKTFIISSNDQSAAFDVIGQMEWFDLINETLIAFLIVPLYSILNEIYKTDKKNFAKHNFKICLVTFFIYALFSSGVLFYGIVLIGAMNPNGADIATMNIYLQIETIAFMTGIVVSFVNVVFIVIGKDINVYIFLAVQICFLLIVDLVMIPNMGIYGAALANVIVNTALAISGILWLHIQKHIRFDRFRKSDFRILKQWGKIGVFSGIQQFIDNFIYAVMVCKMVNMVSEQGNYWIANNFIWGWLLVPVSALSEIIKRDCKNGYRNLHQFNYYFIAINIAAMWAITVPLWLPFFRYAENLQNAEEIFSITVKLAPFYAAYIVCTIADNIFIGLGRTIYNVINSLIINLVYYGIFYILYLVDAVIFDMDMIIVMFGFGMVTHLAISLIEEKLFLRKMELKRYRRELVISE